MTPLTLAVIFASPAMFPDLHPLAVWIGMGSVAVALGLLWKADDFGNCEGGFRADEAKAILAVMKPYRVG